MLCSLDGGRSGRALDLSGESDYFFCYFIFSPRGLSCMTSLFFS